MGRRDKNPRRARRGADTSAGATVQDYHICGLLHAVNTRCRGAASASRGAHPLAGIAAVIGAFIQLAAAPAQPPAAAADPPEAALGALRDDAVQPSSPARTLAAYRAVQTWVRDWSVPADPEALAAADQGGRALLTPVYGACIQLRLHGRLLGRGSAMVAQAGGPPAPELIAQAARAAIAEADERLPISSDLDRAAAVRELARDVQISLELAGAPVPVAGPSWAEVDAVLAPGLDGVLARVGAARSEPVFPSSMMIAGLLPQKALRGLAAKVLGDQGATEVLRPLAELKEVHGLSVSRFRVTHLAQTGPGAEPEFLYRGAREIRLAQIDTRALHTFARAAAERSAARLDQAREGRQPAAGAAHKPGADDVFSEAIATYALLRYTGYAPDENLRSRAEASLGRLVELALAGDAEVAMRHQASLSAAALLAATGACDRALRDPGQAAVPSPSPDELPGSCDAVRRLVPPAFACFLPGFGFDNTVPEPVRPLIVLSYARSASLGAAHADVPFGFDADSLELTARTALGGQMLVARPAELVARMPWLGWAAVTLSPAGKDVPGAVGLREMRREIWKHQLTALDAGDDAADMVGGIVFTSGSASPLPTWQSARPMAFLATMLGDERLTEPAERPLELARLLQAFRFLRQLQVDDSCGWFHPDPSQAVGAIRAATWDQTLPPDATSLGLLAATELLSSMERLAATPNPPSKP